MKGRPISQKEKEDVKLYYNLGYSIKNIRETLGLSNPSVLRILNEAGLRSPRTSPKPITTGIENKVIEFHNDGKSGKEISNILNISPQNVSKILARNNFELREKKYHEQEEKDKIVEMFKDGYNKYQISKKLNINLQTIYDILEKAKLYQPESKKFGQRIIDQIIEDYKNNILVSKISEKYNISKRNIYIILAQNNIIEEKEKIMEESKICPKCNFIDNRNSANFCFKCGTKLVNKQEILKEKINKEINGITYLPGFRQLPDNTQSDFILLINDINHYIKNH